MSCCPMRRSSHRQSRIHLLDHTVRYSLGMVLICYTLASSMRCCRSCRSNSRQVQFFLRLGQTAAQGNSSASS